MLDGVQRETIGVVVSVTCWVKTEIVHDRLKACESQSHAKLNPNAPSQLSHIPPVGRHGTKDANDCGLSAIELRRNASHVALFAN
jgi:hypothetical protein